MDFLPEPVIQVFFYLFMVSLCALGVVYIISRMLFVELNPKQKNIIAIISMAAVSFGLLTYLDPEIFDHVLDKTEIIRFILRWVFYFLGSSVVYVLFMFRMYSRVDHLLDKEISGDNKPKEVSQYEKSLKKKQKEKKNTKFKSDTREGGNG